MQEFASKTIFLDTAPLIYFIEGHSIYQPVLIRFFESIDKGSFQTITSTITLLEVLVKPLREGHIGIANQYNDILTSASGIEVFDVTHKIAIRAAHLRAKYQISTPDSIQLATSLELGADYFFTNDNRLRIVSEVKIVTVNELESVS